MRQIVTGDSHRSQHANTLHFGLGEADHVERVEIQWPNGPTVTLSRPEVDKSRIGCCGHSGCGTAAMYLCALEPRIHAAIVVEGHTENVAGANYQPPGAYADAEQNIVSSLSLGIDRGDLLAAFVPRPLLICFTHMDVGATYSPHYEHGTREIYQELTGQYGLCRAAEKVAASEAELRMLIAGLLPFALCPGLGTRVADRLERERAAVTRHGPNQPCAAASLLRSTADLVPGIVNGEPATSFARYSGTRSRRPSHQNRNDAALQTSRGTGRRFPDTGRKANLP